MATQVKVIITKDYIYSTYVETISFKAPYGDEENMWQVLKDAKSNAFSYGSSFGSVLLESIDKRDESLTDDNIFEYLKQCHSRK